MDYTLRNALAIEVRHFFKKQEIFKNHRAAGANREGILVVAYGAACIGGHEVLFVLCH